MHKTKVDGTVIEYSFGKTHTRIKDVGEYPNEDVGISNVRYVESYDGEHISLAASQDPNKFASFIRGLSV